MYFMEAVKLMKQGKKVRRLNYGKGAYKMLNESGFLVFQGNCSPTLNVMDFEATDWEVYEEKKTLSDKIFDKDLEKEVGIDLSKVYVKDLKPRLIEFIDFAIISADNSVYDTQAKLIPKATELFGVELIK